MKKSKLEKAVEKLVNDYGYSFEAIVKEAMLQTQSGDADLLDCLTERGYNVIKTTSIKEQMELEEWVARVYPHLNQRENLYLTM